MCHCWWTDDHTVFKLGDNVAPTKYHTEISYSYKVKVTRSLCRVNGKCVRVANELAATWICQCQTVNCQSREITADKCNCETAETPAYIVSIVSAIGVINVLVLPVRDLMITHAALLITRSNYSDTQRHVDCLSPATYNILITPEVYAHHERLHGTFVLVPSALSITEFVFS